jgi:hypothetical protein
LSEDGGYLCFRAQTKHVIESNSPEATQVWIIHMKSGTIYLASVDPSGKPGGTEEYSSISGNGRYVVFSSANHGLVPEPAYGNTEIYVRDLVAGITSRASTTSEVRFRDNLGNPLPMPIGGQMTATVRYSLDPYGTTEIQPAAGSTLQSGSVQVVSDRGWDSAVKATLVFDVFGKFVSVDSCPPWQRQRFFASLTAAENTGLALQNPSTHPIKATLELHQTDKVLASAQLQLEPGEQRAYFVDNASLFSTWFENDPGDFRGWVLLDTDPSFNPLSAVGLIQRKNSGALIAVAAGRRAYPN